MFSAFIAVLSFGFLGGILWQYWPTLTAYSWHINVLFFGVACIMYALYLPLVAWAWSLILEQLGTRIGFREHLRIYCLTLVAGRIPGVPWHIAGRTMLYKQIGISATVTAVASAVELLLVIVSGLISGLLIWFRLPDDLQARLIWLAPVPVLGLGMMHPRIIRWLLKRLIPAAAGVQWRYRNTLFLLLMYFVLWTIGGTVLYMVIIALYPLSWIELPAVIGAWGLAGTIALFMSISPASFGIKEIALSLLVAVFVPVGLAVIIAVLVRLVLTAMEFIWAVAASRM